MVSNASASNTLSEASMSDLPTKLLPVSNSDACIEGLYQFLFRLLVSNGEGSKAYLQTHKTGAHKG